MIGDNITVKENEVILAVHYQELSEVAELKGDGASELIRVEGPYRERQ